MPPYLKIRKIKKKLKIIYFYKNIKLYKNIIVRSSKRYHLEIIIIININYFKKLL